MKDNHIVLKQLIMNSEATSKREGKYKVKMATVGERNKNGLIIDSEKSIEYSNESYPLFFEHRHDMENVLGTFKVIGFEKGDMIAEITVTNEKARKLIDDKALKYSSITYSVKEYEYDKNSDSLIVLKAKLIELSLVLNPADETAEIMTNKLKVAKNAEGEDTMKDNELLTELTEAVKALGETFNTFADLVTESLVTISDKVDDALNLLDETDDKEDDIEDEVEDDKKDETDDETVEIEVANKLNALRSKWQK